MSYHDIINLRKSIWLLPFFFLFLIDPEEGVGNSHAALKHQTPVPEPTSPTTDDIQITMGEVILYHKKFKYELLKIPCRPKGGLYYKAFFILLNVRLINNPFWF